MSSFQVKLKRNSNFLTTCINQHFISEITDYVSPNKLTTDTQSVPCFENTKNLGEKKLRIYWFTPAEGETICVGSKMRRNLWWKQTNIGDYFHLRSGSLELKCSRMCFPGLCRSKKSIKGSEVKSLDAFGFGALSCNSGGGWIEKIKVGAGVLKWCRNKTKCFKESCEKSL